MDPRTKFLLEDMLENARLAQTFIGARDFAAFSAEVRLVYATARAVEIVGEAASQLGAKEQSAFPNIPWREAIGMRNRLIHGYRTLDKKILFDTVCSKLPPLIAELERILNEGSKPDGA